MKLARYINLESWDWETILAAAKDAVDNHQSLLVFPEGHRSRDGKMGRFHSGAFKIAVDTQIPVFALCITGTDVLMPPSRWWLKPATVRIHTLGPIQPPSGEDELDHLNFRKQVKKLIAAEVDKMRIENAA